MVLVVSPAAKSTVPVGRVPPKSAASTPDTVQSTLLAAPAWVRVTVKVRGRVSPVKPSTTLA
jgi:hypothetical protein